MKYKIQTLNNIAAAGLNRFAADQYQISNQEDSPDAIILRSHKLHDMDIPSSLKCVGRAGAGVNNIPLERMSENGVVVFNTPGANANSVKELVIAGMLLASRNLTAAWQYTNNLSGSEAEITQAVESGKKKFAGSELKGKTIGIVGLGAIGRNVANICVELDMNVIGYDPLLTIDGAWQMSASVEHTRDIKEVYRRSDFITCHVPMTEQTKHMIDAAELQLMQPKAVLLNFARHGIVHDAAVKKVLQQGMLLAYVTDFPNNIIAGTPGVIALPHLGASTLEAEENCAKMVVDQIKSYLLDGNIINSVNLPHVVLARGSDYRLAVISLNEANMVGQISTCLTTATINIQNMINQTREGLTYTLIDTDAEIPSTCFEQISAIQGVLSARLL